MRGLLSLSLSLALTHSLTHCHFAIVSEWVSDQGVLAFLLLLTHSQSHFAATRLLSLSLTLTHSHPAWACWMADYSSWLTIIAHSLTHSLTVALLAWLTHCMA